MGSTPRAGVDRLGSEGVALAQLRIACKMAAEKKGGSATSRAVTIEHGTGNARTVGGNDFGQN